MPDQELDSIISRYINRPKPVPKGPRPDQIDLSRYYQRPEDQEEAPDDGKFGLDDALAFGLRGAASFAPPGIIGGAVGAGTEWGVEKFIEGREPNLKRVAFEGALNAIPFGTTAKIGRAALKGMGLGVGGAIGQQQTESPEGLHAPTLEEAKQWGLPAIFGGVGGAGAYGIGKYLGRGKTEVPPVVPPRLTTGTGSRYIPQPEGPLPPLPTVPPTSGQRVTTGGFSMRAPVRPDIPPPTGTGAAFIKPPDIANQPPIPYKLDVPAVRPPEATTPTVKPPVSTVPITPAKIGDELIPEQGPIEKRIFLPRDLQGAKPYFNMGNKEYRPEYNNDVDKALMIVAQKKPSKRDKDYIKWLQKYTGMEPDQLRAAGERVKSKIKTFLKDKPVGAIKLPKLHDVQLTKPARPTRTIAMGEGIGDVTTGPTVKAVGDVPSVKIEPPDEPQFARTKKGGLKTGVSEDTAIRVITNLYEKNIGTIATKELMQNSIDEINRAGNKGNIYVDLDKGSNRLSVTDEGRGMTLKQVETVYTDIGRTGKEAGGTDIGGYGIAKAAFQLGGERFTLSTVAKYKDGKKYRVDFTGTPAELRAGSNVPSKTEVPMDTPTGTKVTVEVVKDEPLYLADKFTKNVGLYSGTQGKIKVRSRDYAHEPTLETKPYEDVPNSVISGKTSVGEVDNKEFNAKMFIPHDVTYRDSDKITLILTNRGMYQGSHSIDVSQTHNLPDRVVVDINSKVDALDNKYPFTPSRENIKWNAEYKIKKGIEDYIVNPTRAKRAEEIDKLYKGLPNANFTNKGPRGFTFLDPVGKLTSGDMARLENDPVMNHISGIFSEFVEDSIHLMRFHYPNWNETLDKIGFMHTEPGFWGLHLPNPKENKSAILINPLNHFVNAFGDSQIPPQQAVTNMVHTMVHEIAHFPKETAGRLVPHEDADFEVAIGKLYGELAFKRRTYEDRILQGVTDDADGRRYNSGVQSLLQFYSEATRRAGTKGDLLTGEGIKSANQGFKKSQTIPPNSRGNGGGDSWYSGGKKWIDKNVTYRNVVDAANVAKSFSSAGDISAPMRQGIFLMGRDSWRRSWIPMLKALKTSNHDDLLAKRLADPFYAEAEKNGLVFTSQGRPGATEESYASQLAKKIPIFGKGLIAPSERAFTTFLDELRLGTYKDLVTKGRKLGVPINEKNIAQYVNAASGRGTMGLTIGSESEAAEKAATLLNTTFFSPRYIASRIQLLNPVTYAKLDPFTRKEALRDLATLTSVASTVLATAHAAGAEVETDPREADFGKFKKGNTRVDMLGGFGPYIRFFAQTVNGMATDEPGPDVSRFIESKLSPAARAVRDSIQQKDYLRKDTTVPKAVATAFAPILAQDVYNLWKEDPNLIPLIGGTTAAAVGIPVQTYGETRVRKRQGSGFPTVNLPKMPSMPSLP